MIAYALSLVVIIYLYTRYNLIPSIHSFLSNLSFLQYDYIIINLLLYFTALLASFSLIAFLRQLGSKFGQKNLYVISTLFSGVVGRIVVIIGSLILFKAFPGSLLRGAQIYLTILMCLVIFDLRVWDLIGGLTLFINPLYLLIYRAAFYFFRV